MRPHALALLMCGIAAQAGAQPASETAKRALPSDDEIGALLSDPRTRGKEAYALGVRLFEVERYEAAERAWLRAHALGRNAVLLLAVADARERRGDAPGAVAMLEQYLRDRPEAPDRVAIEARIATLRKTPAILVVRSEEPGHAILLDGAPIDAKTPARVEVEPGAHSVLVVGEGSQVGEKTVHVGYGEVKELDFTRDTESDATIAQSEEAVRQLQAARAREDQIVRRASISTGSIALGAFATGAVLGALAFDRQRDNQNAPSARAADQRDAFALGAQLTLSLAVLSGVTSLTLFLTHKKKKKQRERETASLQIDVRGAGAAATLSF